MTFWLVVAGIALALLWALAMWESVRDARRDRQRRGTRDAVAYLDQWTAERRQRLADMQHSAPKGIDARRHTVVGHKARP